MHINYFRIKKNNRKGVVEKRLSKRKEVRECGICEINSDKVTTEWIKGPGGYYLCNSCGLRYLQVLAIEDPYKLNPEYANQSSPMIYIKIIFILAHQIPLSRLKQIFITLYETLNGQIGRNHDFYLLIDGYSYLKVKDNLFQFIQ